MPYRFDRLKQESHPLNLQGRKQPLYGLSKCFHTLPYGSRKEHFPLDSTVRANQHIDNKHRLPQHYHQNLPYSTDTTA